MTPEFYTPDELAAELRITADTVRKWLRENKMPGATRPGGMWRVPQAVYQAFIQSSVVHPKENTPNAPAQ